MSEDSSAENKIVPYNEGQELVIPSNDCAEVAEAPEEDSTVLLNQGTFHRANFGPQTNSQINTATDYRGATITHHHHYDGTDEGPVPSVSGGARREIGRSSAAEKGYERLSETIIMSNMQIKKDARIYKGAQKHISGARLVAIKFVSFNLKTMKEAKHLLKLAYHPNVVQIIESRKIRGAGSIPEMYIAMELCSSRNLQDYVNENREKNIPLDFTQTMSYAIQLVEGIYHIHDNGIIHGDLKPDNLLFTHDGKFLKVSDFGLSKELRHGRSVTKVSNRGQGTDGYRAPEVYLSDLISQFADIFSLGLVLFVLWTNGKHPFGEEIDLWNYNIKNNKDRDLSGLLIPEEMRDEFLQLLDRMLKFIPKQRPTAKQIKEHPFFRARETVPEGENNQDGGVGDPLTVVPYGQQSSAWSSDEEELIAFLEQVDFAPRVGDSIRSLSDGATHEEKSTDSSRLYDCNLVVKYGKDVLIVQALKNVFRGYLIHYSRRPRKSSMSEELLDVNGDETPVSKLEGVDIKQKKSSFFKSKPAIFDKFRSGIALWFETKSRLLCAVRLCEASVHYYDTFDECVPKIPLEKGKVVPIFSINKYTERYQKNQGAEYKSVTLYVEDLKSSDKIKIELLPSAIEDECCLL